MKKFFKDLYDPKKCDDVKLVKRFQFTDKVTGVGAGMVFFGVIGGFLGVLAGVCVVAGSMPWIVPAVLLGGGLCSFAAGLPITGWGNSKHMDYIAECKKRQICPPGEQAHQYIQYKPSPTPAPAVQAPVLSDVFDAAAAVTLGENVRAMPAIKLKSNANALSSRKREAEAVR